MVVFVSYDGRTWSTAGAAFKPFPTLAQSHRFLTAAAIARVGRADLCSQQVADEVHVHAGDRGGARSAGEWQGSVQHRGHNGVSVRWVRCS